MTNSSQSVTATATYEGFGQTIATTGSSTDPYMFAATSRYRNDGDAGLMHVGARYYDAQVGRFITRDTKLDEKPYLYCEHDPVNYLDPIGHMPDWLRKAINIGEDVVIGAGVITVGILILPEAGAVAVIGGGILGAFGGGAISANDYYWDNPDDWNMNDFWWNVGRGAVNGSISGALAGPYAGGVKNALGPAGPERIPFPTDVPLVGSH